MQDERLRHLGSRLGGGGLREHGGRAWSPQAALAPWTCCGGWDVGPPAPGRGGGDTQRPGYQAGARPAGGSGGLGRGVSALVYRGGADAAASE